MGTRTAPGPSARPTRAAPAQREPASLGSCRRLHKKHGPCDSPARPAGPVRTPCSSCRADAIPVLILQGRRNPPARFAGPVRFPARFAGPVHGVERSGPACGALCSERRGMSRRTGKSRSSRRALARICPKRRAVTGFACISPAKRALEAPFPVRRARDLHVVQAGGRRRGGEGQAKGRTHGSPSGAHPPFPAGSRLPHSESAHPWLLWLSEVTSCSPFGLTRAACARRRASWAGPHRAERGSAGRGWARASAPVRGPPRTLGIRAGRGPGAR